MSAHDGQTSAEHRLEVLLGPGHGLEVVADPTTDEDAVDEDDQPSGSEAEEPEAYGLRVGCQSEAEKLEAAEFMIATRVRQDARLRATHVERLRHTDDD